MKREVAGTNCGDLRQIVSAHNGQSSQLLSTTECSVLPIDIYEAGILTGITRERIDLLSFFSARMFKTVPNPALVRFYQAGFERLKGLLARANITSQTHLPER